MQTQVAGRPEGSLVAMGAPTLEGAEMCRASKASVRCWPVRLKERRIWRLNQAVMHLGQGTKCDMEAKEEDSGEKKGQLFLVSLALWGSSNFIGSSRNKLLSCDEKLRSYKQERRPC